MFVWIIVISYWHHIISSPLVEELVDEIMEMS